MSNIKRFTKRGLSVFLALVMCLSLLPTAAFATGEDAVSEPVELDAEVLYAQVIENNEANEDGIVTVSVADLFELANAGLAEVEEDHFLTELTIDDGEDPYTIVKEDLKDEDAIFPSFQITENSIALVPETEDEDAEAVVVTLFGVFDNWAVEQEEKTTEEPTYATVDELNAAFEAVGEVLESGEVQAGIDALDEYLDIYNRLSPEDQETNAEALAAAQAYRETLVAAKEAGENGEEAEDPDVDTLASLYNPVTIQARVICQNPWTEISLGGNDKAYAGGGTESYQAYYQIPSLNHFLAGTAYEGYDYGRVTKVVGSYHLPASGNSQVGANVEFGTNKQVQTITYWVSQWKAPHSHSYSWVQTTAPTCYSNGTETYKCSCGATNGTRSIPASESYHTWGNWYNNGNGKEQRDCNYNYHHEYRDIQVQKVTLTYDANGGSNPPSAVTKDSGTKFTIKNKQNMTHTGDYTFLGWNTDKDATSADSKWGFGEEVVLTANTTLYAVWKQNQPGTKQGNFTVQKSFVGLEAGVEGPEVSLTYEAWRTKDGAMVGEKQTSNVALTKQTDGTYTGTINPTVWDIQNGNGDDPERARYKNIIVIAEDTDTAGLNGYTWNSFNARYPADGSNDGSNKVKFVLDGTTFAKTLSVKNTYTKNVAKITVTWKDGYSETAIRTESIEKGSDYNSLYPNAPTREGYAFDKWGAPVTDDAGNITITAQWAQFTITKIPDKAKYTAGEDVTWTIMVSHNGESTIKNLNLTDTLQGVTLTAKEPNTNNPANFNLDKDATAAFTATLSNAAAGTYKNKVELKQDNNPLGEGEATQVVVEESTVPPVEKVTVYVEKVFSGITKEQIPSNFQITWAAGTDSGTLTASNTSRKENNDLTYVWEISMAENATLTLTESGAEISGKTLTTTAEANKDWINATLNGTSVPKPADSGNSTINISGREVTNGGQSTDGYDVSDSASSTVTGVIPAAPYVTITNAYANPTPTPPVDDGNGISITKTRTSGDTAKAGDTITWNIVVKNNSNVQKIVTLAEQTSVNLSKTSVTLAAGASETVTASYVVTGNETVDDNGKFFNTVKATTGEKGDKENPEDTDDGTKIEKPTDPTPKEYDVIVKYVDENDKEIKSSVTVKTTDGGKYDVNNQKVDIADYKFIEVKNDVSLTGTVEEDTTIVLVYTKDTTPTPTPETVAITVNFVDENGTIVGTESKTTEKGTDKTYDVTEEAGKIPEGWILDPDRQPTGDPVTGTADNDKLITVPVTKDTIGPNTDDPSNPNKPDGIADKYQVVLKYVAGSNGAVSGDTTKVIELKDDAGNHVSQTAITPGTTGVTTAPNNGYHFDTWTPNPANQLTVQGGNTYTFTASFAANGGGGSSSGGNGGGGGGGSTNIPDNPTPLDPGTQITDPDVPLAVAPGLNSTDHFAYIIGYPDGTVRPQGNITRAEVATIFFRLMTDEFRTTNWASTNSFPDVASASLWYNNAVSTAAKAGLLKGKEDGNFHPSQNITRAEFATIAARFLSDEEITAQPFPDTVGHWAEKDIIRAVQAGWIKGDSDGNFRPNDPITRAEAMTLVNRMLDRVPDKDHMLSDMVTWPDNPESAWFYEAVQEATNSHDYERDELGVTETWTGKLADRDWSALEKEWSDAASSTGSDVADNLQK